MEWQGYTSVAALVDERVKEAAIKNPGPLRSVSLRLPVTTEAKLVVLSEILSTQKSALMRDLLMTALQEAERKLLDGVLADDEAQSDYTGRVEHYRRALLEGSDHRHGDPEIAGRITQIETVEGD